MTTTRSGASRVVGIGLAAGLAAVAVVFTGGAGEKSARLRGDACRGLGFLGLAIDDDVNERSSGDRVVSPAGALGAVVVVAAREDLEIAALVRSLLGGSGGLP